MRTSENEAYAEVSLDEESFDDFLVAIVVSKSDATGDINDQQFLTQGQIAALGSGSGNSAEMAMPQGLSEDLYAQVWILDDEGQLWAGPVMRMGDAIADAGSEG
ncbi:MAG: hypothetical protein ACYTG5_01930 [Planctomycetota bacterium]